MRLALELPSSRPPGTGTSWDELRAAAVAAEQSGFDALWVSGDEGDPVTLAGALAAVTSAVTLGVVAGLRATDRRPSVLARDVTSLDVLSSGRAAVLLDAPGPMAAEAAQVCHLLFTGDAAHLSGEWFTLDGAVNRPPPVGSPKVLIQSHEPPRDLQADGWVTTAGPDEVGEWRRRAQGTSLYWRGSLGDDPATMAAALFDQGVDGLIARVSGSAAEVEHLADLLP